GVVALLEPFIDTILICTMTALVIISTNTWDDRVPSTVSFAGGQSSWVSEDADGRFVRSGLSAPAEVVVQGGVPVAMGVGDVRLAWRNVAVDSFYTDAAQTQP